MNKKSFGADAAFKRIKAFEEPVIVSADERNISLDIGFSTYYCRFDHGCNAVHVDLGFYNWAGDVPPTQVNVCFNWWFTYLCSHPFAFEKTSILTSRVCEIFFNLKVFEC